LFNLSIEPLFNALRANMNGITINHRAFVLRAYADDTYIGGTGLYDWSTLQLWLDRHYIAANGKINWSKTSFFPLSPTSSYHSPPYPSPASLPLSTLGVLLPITPENSSILWNSLLQKAKSRTASLTERNLTIRGRILVLKTFVMSLFGYHASVSPPPQNIITQLQTLVNQFVWKGRHTHPNMDTSSLSLLNGGINLPIVKIEMEIRLAKTISQAFSPSTPFWVHAFNHLLQNCTSHTSITQCITQHRSTRLAIEPLCSCLTACRRIENSQANTISSLPSLQTLRNILHPQPHNNPILLTLPSIGPVSWKEIFHTDCYRAASDLLWLATWQRLPIGRPIAKISPDKSQCPWCPNTEHNTLHLFHQCHIASTIWDTTHLIYTACTHSQPPPHTPDPSLTPQQLHLLRSLQSAAILTMWNAFTSRAFGHNPTLSISHILNQLLGRLLFLHMLDLHIDSLTPWINPTNILSIITCSKARYISPFP